MPPQSYPADFFKGTFKMKIYDIQIGSIEVPGSWSLNIYFSGCTNNKKCQRDLCQNKNLHDFNIGTPFKEMLNRIEATLEQGSNLIKSVCYLGGEPFDQNINDLRHLSDVIKFINPEINIYAYSGYDDSNIDKIKRYMFECSIKDVYIGEYKKDGINQYWLKGEF